MAELNQASGSRSISEVIRRRHSERSVFESDHHIAESHLAAILEAARWAPTAHNMQNFEIVIVDDEVTLASIGRVRFDTSEEFIRENYAQLSFGQEELNRKGAGLLASMFPPSWRDPDSSERGEGDLEHGFLDETMPSCPMVLIVVYDTRKRAPASEGDLLGIMSLGCVMENMRLTAEALGIAMQIMSVFSGHHVEEELRKILSIPDFISIAFACRLSPVAWDTPRLSRDLTFALVARSSDLRTATRSCPTKTTESIPRPGSPPPSACWVPPLLAGPSSSQGLPSPATMV
jgi:nitroreductase